MPVCMSTLASGRPAGTSGAARSAGAPPPGPRSRDLPQPLDSIRPGEQRLIAEHRVQDQPLVTLEFMRPEEGIRITEDHFCLTEAHGGTGFLGQEARGDPAWIIKVDDELVSLTVPADPCVNREHPQRRLLL